jgi:arylsulfatase A-like enzyme
MRANQWITSVSIVALGALLSCEPGLAQQVTGTPGSPNATTTIPGNQLPPPSPKFGGVINEQLSKSKPWWPPLVAPPKDAPNVLLIMTDDQGYGVPSTFGGVIPTPTLDRIAANGLRYTQMHSTALCSPTRAAVITGRNHHDVGFGVVAEISTGYPGYDAYITPDKATIGTILRDNGYATSWFGKDHNTPTFMISAAGPFTQWPSGMGFEYFYGFPGGETNQWAPYLFRNHTQIFPWVGKPGWNLITGMADDAISHMRQLKAEAPDKPFFVYYVPGGTHSPHNPTKEWIDKISAMHLFDKGWNDLRDTIFANQKRLGVIPANAQLTPWPDEEPGKLPRWETLSDEQKKLYIKQADVFAAYVAYTDHEIGRVVQEVEDEGKLDNTLIIFISGDNGTSAEGTLTGEFNDIIGYNGILEVPLAENMKYYDSWGLPGTLPHMSVAWAWAFDTPFKWVKQVASHFGGTRQGMAISWPGHITDKGGIRNQFAHVIDIVPTILEATKIKAPEVVNGIAQKPIEGTSLVYTFDKANADAPTRHTTQYFEMRGYRGIYHDGWYANTEVPAAPWSPVIGVKWPEPQDYKWELYKLSDDWTQYDSVGAKNPDKLNQMQEVFTQEAWKNNVFPLDNNGFARALQPRPNSGVTEFSYTGEISGITLGSAPPVLGRSFTITAQITVPDGSAEGMLVTDGGEAGGYGLYLLNGKPVFTYNYLGLERFRWEGPVLTPGKHTVVFDFTYDGPGVAKGGTGVLRVDGTDVDTKRIPHTIAFLITLDETFDLGVDTRTGVNDADYHIPFRFTGTIDKLTVKPGPEQFTEGDRQIIRHALDAAKD